MKVAFFVDGQNLFHNLKGLNKKLREENIDWGKLFSSCLSDGEEISKVYWFRPKDIEEQIKLNRNTLYRKIVAQKYPHKPELLNKLNRLPAEVFKVVNKEYEEYLDWWKNEKRRFFSVHRKYQKLVNDYKFMNLYRSGVLKVDTYNQIIVGEKGVDVALAVKTIETILLGECDRVVLVSSDSDYEEVVKCSMRHSKNIKCISFGKMSNRLEAMVDGMYEFSCEDLQSKFCKS